MSSISGIEAKVENEILHSANNTTGSDAACEEDDVEKDHIAELLASLPKLTDTFNVHRKIGEGTFSSVYLASMKQDSEQLRTQRLYAVKHLVPTTHPTRLAHELRCLRDIGGKNYVIGVEMCLRHEDNVVFIMPYVRHSKFSEYVQDMGADELRNYMRALLIALRHVHSFGVIHRDVKPSNFLYDRQMGRYALVDFGLAQHVVTAQPPPAHQTLKRRREEDYVVPGPKRMALDLSSRENMTNALPTPKEVLTCPCPCWGQAGVCSECIARPPARANRAGTQGFRPPEVLLKYKDQGTEVDMWAAGVILASVLTGRYPFFRATDDLTALVEFAAFLGTVALQRTACVLGSRIMVSGTRRGMCLRKLAVIWRCAPAPADPAADLADLAADLAAGPAADSTAYPPPCAACVRRGCVRCACPDDAPAYMIDPERTVVGFPDAAFALAARLLEPDPRRRLTAAAALAHPFLNP